MINHISLIYEFYVLFYRKGCLNQNLFFNHRENEGNALSAQSWVHIQLV